MFTEREKKLIIFILQQKYDIAKEITRCCIKEQKENCLEVEEMLKSILEKLK
jgi:hypothetical protein